MENEVAESTARKYELMLIISGELSDDEAAKAVEQVKAQFVEKGGDIFYEDSWGRQDLAYTIKNLDTGHYVVWNLTIDPEHLRDLDQTLQLDNNVLRHLLIQVQSGYEVQKFDADEVHSLLHKKKPKGEEEEEPKKVVKKEIKKEKPVPVESAPIVEKPEVKEEEGKEEAPAPEVVAEVKEEPESEEKTKEKLDAVDEKLRDILSDKDLNL